MLLPPRSSLLALEVLELIILEVLELVLEVLELVLEVLELVLGFVLEVLELHTPRTDPS